MQTHVHTQLLDNWTQNNENNCAHIEKEYKTNVDLCKKKKCTEAILMLQGVNCYLYQTDK